MTYKRPPTPWLKKGKTNRKTIHSQVFVPASQEVDNDGLNRDSYFSQPALPSSPLAANTLKLEYLKLDSPRQSLQPQSYTPIFSFINEYFSNDILQKTPDEKDFLKRPEKSSYPHDDLERSYFSDDSSDSSGEGTLQDENDSFSVISNQDEMQKHPHLPSSEAQYKLRMRIYYEQKLRSLSMRQHRSINVMEWLNSVDA